MALADAKRVDRQTREELTAWFKVARQSDWTSFEDIRRDYVSVDRVGSVLIFNIRHNTYRLIVRHALPAKVLFVKALLTHKEYDRKEWMKWA